MNCSHDPRKTTGPIGMYHCPECGDMVLAGLHHPPSEEDIDWDDPEVLKQIKGNSNE